MKLRLSGGYRLCSDGRCITLTQRCKAKSGKSSIRLVGHFPRLSDALNRALEEKISDSDASTIEQLRGDIFSFYKETEKLSEKLTDETK